MGKPVTVALNRRYLLNALRFGLNQVEIEDDLSPVVFSKGGKKMVIMPVKLDGPVRVRHTRATQFRSNHPNDTSHRTNRAPGTTGGDNRRKDRHAQKAARATTPEAMTTFQPVETHANNNGNGNGSAIKSLVDHVEQIKENLKNVIRDLSTVVDAVKAAEKEKRTSDKEIDAIRTKLRQIQNVTI